MGLINEFSIQLYSVRHETAENFPLVLKKLGAIGYTGVEFAGYNNIPAIEMRKYLDEYGLKSVGSHVGIQKLTDNLEEELEYNQILGTEYIVIPHTNMKSRTDALHIAELANEIGEKCVNAGFEFAYHNHNHEFAKDGSDYLLDIFFENVNPEICKMQLDLYWAAYAGVEPTEYMKVNSKRLRTLHIKQIKDFESRKCVDLGDGIIDFAQIISAGKQYGVKHFILEQEEFEIDAFTSVENGFKHIMSL